MIKAMQALKKPSVGKAALKKITAKTMCAVMSLTGSGLRRHHQSSHGRGAGTKRSDKLRPAAHLPQAQGFLTSRDASDEELKPRY